MIPIGKREITKMAKVLSDESLTTAEGAAEAALRAAYEIYESRAKWVVVGQLKWADAQQVSADRADRVCLGAFATESAAQTAGKQLAFSTKTNETFRWWMLPIRYDTPDRYYISRRDARDSARLAALGRPLPEVAPTCDPEPEEGEED